MAKDGPVIIFDSNFVLDHESLLAFIDYCRQWAIQLHGTASGVSMKFEYNDEHRQRANFMWQGISFVQIYPGQVHLERIKQYCACLIKGNLNSGRGSYYPMENLWKEVFLPNLLAAVKQEQNRLNRLEQELIVASIEERPPVDFRHYL